VPQRLFEEEAFAERLVDRDEGAGRVVRTFRGRSDACLEDPIAIDLVDSLISAYLPADGDETSSPAASRTA